MTTIAVNPPKTPVTEGSGGKAVATMPNVCKMPGPPAPFVPTPLPNIGNSSDNLSDGTTTVQFEGKKVAIKGSSFKSMGSGDAASQGTGGGIVSATTQGKTEWVAPGSLDVKAEGKNIQLLGDATTNNGGSAANSGTTNVAQQPKTAVQVLQDIACKCDKQVKANKQSTCRELGTKKHECCNKAVQQHKNQGKEPKLAPERGYDAAGNRMRMTRTEALFSGQIRGTCWPDACTLSNTGQPTQLFDFKFKCPAGTRTRRKKGGGWHTCDGTQAFPTFSPRQLANYEALSRQLGIDPAQNPPTPIDTQNCK